MDVRIQELPKLTTRAIRKWFVSYCKDAYPKYGQSRVDKLSYQDFKRLALHHEVRYQELFQLYEHFPDSAAMPQEVREQAIMLEQELSRLEHVLCL